MAFAQEARILSGTRLPLRTRRCRCVFTAKLDACDSLTAHENSAVSHRNAGFLFPRLVPQKDSSRTPHRVIEAIGRDLRCQPSSPPRGIIKPWIARQSGCCIGGLLAGTDPHQCDLSHFRFSTEVTNRQKGEDFHSRQPSPISLTQPSGTIATPQVAPEQRLGAPFKAA
jgi:hypothetical protein